MAKKKKFEINTGIAIAVVAIVAIFVIVFATQGTTGKFVAAPVKVQPDDTINKLNKATIIWDYAGPTPAMSCDDICGRNGVICVHAETYIPANAIWYDSTSCSSKVTNAGLSCTCVKP